MTETVKPVRVRNLPYEVLVLKHKHKDAEQWCQENLGPRWEAIGNRSGIWTCFWAGFPRPPDPVKSGSYRYYFESAEDAMMFVLRFGRG